MPRLPLSLSLVLCVAFAPGCATDWSITDLSDPNAEADDDPGFLADRPEPPADEPHDGDGDDGHTDAEPDPDPEPDPEPEPEPDDPAPADDCADTSDLVYVIDRGLERLMLYDPATTRFEVLGELDCPSGSTPASMAVSREGFAYVRYSDNVVYEVDLTDLGCVETDLGVPGGFGSFGMGYATDDAGTWRDRMYVADADTLGRVDSASWSVQRVGTMPSQSELTGNAQGELWAFLPLERTPALVQLDTDSGAELDRISLSGFPDLGDLDAFAFASWGGEFTIFVRTYGMGHSTDVYQVGADGRLERTLQDVGFDVVGAGVSTCAPDA